MTKRRSRHKGVPRRTVPIAIEESILEGLRIVAAARGVSRAILFEDICREWLKENPPRAVAVSTGIRLPVNEAARDEVDTEISIEELLGIGANDE